jgi:hypothetical protein
MSDARIDALLDPAYLGDLKARPIEEIRSMRTECQRLEVALSYLRRLAQGRLDIVAADQRRRVEGGEPLDVAALVEQLPEILSEHVHAPGNGRLSAYMAPAEADDLTAELDAVVDAQTLGSLDRLDDVALTDLIDRLTALERDVSGRRRALHDIIDALQAELTRRYKTGEASVESLLR